jgi:hypothetical protein
VTGTVESEHCSSLSTSMISQCRTAVERLQ